ncbi:hypothetical protein ATI61_11119 [Archangium gephyra]|uniref:CHP n=1 Tax=Archangium gephyra TaxID=48 RepID=A0AAC8QH86_9BACT|nr:hypothetical protein [Archangium gephyra]AKJ07055.1 CHP [Archangium gephyra]REG26470.1 hypothetical protein ATI61_11119 [Archangium gephyra]
MRRFPSLLLPLSLGLVLVASSCDPDGPDGGSGNDAGNEAPADAGGDAGSDTDAGTDAGTTDAGTDAGVEVPGDPCLLTDAQPSTCTYGSYCSSRSTSCQPVPPPTCANFNKFPVSWDPATSTGPVTYAAELVSFVSDSATCPAHLPMRFQTRIRAYSPSGELPTTASELSKVFSYVNPNGSYISDASQFSNIVTSDDLKNTEFLVSNCIVDQPTVNLGFYFEGGNGLCQTATR